MLVFGVNLGILLIGRYNVTSVVFIFPLCYLLTVLLLETVYPEQMPAEPMLNTHLIPEKTRKMATGTAGPDNRGVNADRAATPGQFLCYCLRQIQTAIPGSPKILGNLNAEYAFADGQLLDYRNLQYLDDQGITFADYVAAQQIEVIIYYDELAVIVANHPRYDVMYGDLTPIDAEMTAFLAEHCEEKITAFSDASYGTNLAPLIDTRPWPIHIFSG